MFSLSGVSQYPNRLPTPKNGAKILRAKNSLVLTSPAKAPHYTTKHPNYFEMIREGHFSTNFEKTPDALRSMKMKSIRHIYKSAIQKEHREAVEQLILAHGPSRHHITGLDMDIQAETTGRRRYA